MKIVYEIKKDDEATLFVCLVILTWVYFPCHGARGTPYATLYDVMNIYDDCVKLARNLKLSNHGASFHFHGA